MRALHRSRMQELNSLLEAPAADAAEGATASSTCSNYAIPVTAAVAYGAASVVATLGNKALLTTWQFDCVFSLLLLQNALTALLLAALQQSRFSKALGLNVSPQISSVIRYLAPVSTISLMNVLCGMWALALSSVPIYQTLKRMSPLPAMLLDAACRGKRFSARVRWSVITVCAGAFLAGCGDLDRHVLGYGLALMSCVLQALYLVLAAQADDVLAIGAQGLLFYSSLLALPLLLPAALVLEVHTLKSYPHWGNPAFIAVLALTLVIGASLQLLLFLCTLVTSAVSTLIVGNLKAVLTTLLGFLLFGRVNVQPLGVLGILINTTGGVLYSMAKLQESRER